MSTSWYQFHLLCSINAKTLRKSIFRASRGVSFSKLTGVTPYHDGYSPTAFRIFADHFTSFNSNPAFDVLNFRSSRPEVLCKKGVFRNFAKFTIKHLCQGLFFNKVAGIACNFIKKETLAYGCLFVAKMYFYIQ